MARTRLPSPVHQLVSAATLSCFCLTLANSANAYSPSASIQRHACYRSAVQFLRHAGFVLNPVQLGAKQEGGITATFLSVSPVSKGGTAPGEVPVMAIFATLADGHETAILVTAIRSRNGNSLAFDVLPDQPGGPVVRWEMSERSQNRLTLSELDGASGQAEILGELSIVGNQEMSFASANPQSVLKKKHNQQCVKDCLKSGLTGLTLGSIVAILACCLGAGLFALLSGGAAAPAIATVLYQCLIAAGITIVLSVITYTAICIHNC